MTKASEKAQKEQSEQFGKLQAQLKSQTDLNAKQSKEFSENLKKVQDAANEREKQYQKQLGELQKQLEEAMSKNKGCASGCMGMVAALIGLVELASWLICIIV